MAFNSTNPASALVTILSGLSGMGFAQIGAPESIGPRVGGYVTLGGMETVRHATGVMQMESRYMVMMVYRVDGGETTAETTLMGLVDSFLSAIHADLTLGGVVDTAQVNSLAADEPNYQLRAGKEYREYPLIVTVIQRDNYAVNP